MTPKEQLDGDAHGRQEVLDAYRRGDTPIRAGYPATFRKAFTARRIALVAESDEIQLLFLC